MLMEGKPKHQCQALREEKFDEVYTWLQQSPCKSLKFLAPETTVSKATTGNTTKQLNIWPYKITVEHSLQLYDSVAILNFCNWYLQSVKNI
jgi:hypothetical protein